MAAVAPKFTPMPAPGSDPTIDSLVADAKARIAAAKWQPLNANRAPFDAAEAAAGVPSDTDPDDEDTVPLAELQFPAVASELAAVDRDGSDALKTAVNDVLQFRLTGKPPASLAAAAAGTAGMEEINDEDVDTAQGVKAEGAESGVNPIGESVAAASTRAPAARAVPAPPKSNNPCDLHPLLAPGTPVAVAIRVVNSFVDAVGACMAPSDLSRLLFQTYEALKGGLVDAPTGAPVVDSGAPHGKDDDDGENDDVAGGDAGEKDGDSDDDKDEDGDVNMDAPKDDDGAAASATKSRSKAGQPQFPRASLDDYEYPENMEARIQLLFAKHAHMLLQQQVGDADELMS